MTQKETTQEACRLQDEYCSKMGYPHFAPLDGRCYDCNKDIYEIVQKTNGNRHWETGIKLEPAGTSHITACPHCSSSYCD